MTIDTAVPRRPSLAPPNNKNVGMYTSKRQNSGLSRHYPTEENMNNVESEERNNSLTQFRQNLNQTERMTLSQQLQLQIQQENQIQRDPTLPRRPSLIQTGTDTHSDFLKNYQATRSKITAMGVLEAYNEGVRHQQVNDLDQAIRYYEYAAKRGHPKAQHNLGSMYENGVLVPKDDETAVNFFRLAAEKGISESQFSLAMHYKEGTGCPKDIKKCIHYLEKAADSGHEKSCFNLGLLYEKGVHVASDPQKALICYTEAAGKGSTKACVNLGLMYSEGRGTKADLPRAIRYFAQAAAKGDATGMFNLSLSYQHGIGVEKDPKKAIKFLEQASEADHPKAQFNLAKAYLSGEGVEGGKDEQKARSLLILSANAGESKASRALQALTEKKNKPPPKADLSHFGVSGCTTINSNPVKVDAMYTNNEISKSVIEDKSIIPIENPSRMRRIIGKPTEEAIARAKAASERRRSVDMQRRSSNGQILSTSSNTSQNLLSNSTPFHKKSPSISSQYSDVYNSKISDYDQNMREAHHRRLSSDFGFDHDTSHQFDGTIPSRNKSNLKELKTISEPDSRLDSIYRRRSSVWVDLRSEEDTLKEKAKELDRLEALDANSTSSLANFFHS